MPNSIGRFSAQAVTAARGLSRAASSADNGAKRTQLSSSSNSVPQSRSLGSSKPTTTGVDPEKFRLDGSIPTRSGTFLKGSFDPIYQAPPGVTSDEGMPSAGKLFIAYTDVKAGISTTATGSNVGQGHHASAQIAGNVSALMIDANKPSVSFGAFSLGVAGELTSRSEGKSYKSSLSGGGSISEFTSIKGKLTLSAEKTRSGEGRSLEISLGDLSEGELSLSRVAQTQIGPNDLSIAEYNGASEGYKSAVPGSFDELHNMSIQVSDGPGRDGADYSQVQEHMIEDIASSELTAALAVRNAAEAAKTGSLFTTPIVTPEELITGEFDKRFEVK